MMVKLFRNVSRNNSTIEQFNNKKIMRLLILFLLLPFFTFAQSIKPLSKSINSDKYTEYAPTFSADGQYMVFQSDNNKYQAWQLYESTLKKNGKWSKPRPIESVNNFGEKPTEANGYQTDFIAAPSLSADGQTLYFTATFHSGLGGRDLYYVTRQKDGSWSRPRNLGTPINTANNEDFASISPDGNQLYFARPLQKSQAGEGCYQLYVAKKVKGRWQTPTKLPRPINTGCEKCVRIQADGVTLIFSSVRNSGKGGFDLYKAVLSVNSKYWESLQPIKEANSAQFDKFATIIEAHNTVYFNSQGKKSPDIFKLSALPDYLRLQRFAQTQGKVLAAQKQLPIKANLKLYWHNALAGGKEMIQQLESKSTTGEYALRLRTGHRYTLEVTAQGYEPKSLDIDLRQHQGGQNSLANIVLAPKVVSKPILALNTTPKTDKKTNGVKSLRGEKVKAAKGEVYTPSKVINIGKNGKVKKATTPVIANDQKKNQKPGASQRVNTAQQALSLRFPRIQFAYKSYDLLASSKAALQEAVKILKKFPSLRMRIDGHTGDIGEPQTNMQLSLERAKTVQTYIIAQGISPQRLFMKAYGETKPLIGGNRRTNRRVEIQLVKGD